MNTTAQPAVRYLDVSHGLSDDLFFVCSDQGLILEANAAWERQLGYTLSQVIGSPLSRFLARFVDSDLDEAHVSELLTSCVAREQSPPLDF